MSRISGTLRENCGQFQKRQACGNHDRASLPFLWDNPRDMNTLTLDLLYLESDPRTGQPSACICTTVDSGHDYAGVKAEKLISAQCLSFIELDAEIRRLHAELDEIRARAKKKFYKAHAAAASA
jgi:hypothetical protein